VLFVKAQQLKYQLDLSHASAVKTPQAATLQHRVIYLGQKKEASLINSMILNFNLINCKCCQLGK